MKRGAALRGALCAVLALGACSEEKPLTEIVLAVDSDIDALRKVRIELENFGDGDPIDVEVDGKSDFPKSLSLVHDGGPLGPIHITVTGYGEDDEMPLIVEPRREIFFQKDKTLLLRVELWEDCLDLCTTEDRPACVHDQDGNPQCTSAEDAVELTEWNGSLDGPNVEMDAAVPGDGSMPMGDGATGGDTGLDGGPDSSQPIVDSGPDVANLPSGEFPYTPTNFVPADDAIAMLERRIVSFDCGETIFNSDDDSFTNGCAQVPVVTTLVQSDLSEAKLLVFEELTVAGGSSLRIAGSKPVVLAVFGDGEIAGNIDVSAVGAQPGPGGNLGCPTGTGQVGQVGSSAGGIGMVDAAEGGGGGGFGSPGGHGGEGAASAPDQGQAGGVDGEPLLSPLRGGCPGGAGGASRDDDPGGAGGGGGGALQISAAGELRIAGHLSAAGGGGGGGGGTEAGGGGGGSGGALLLEADKLVIEASAIFAVNGGGGGAGHDNDNNSDAAAPGSDGTRDTTGPANGGAGSSGAGSGGGGAAFSAPAVAGGNGTPRSNAAIISTPGDGGGGGGGGVGRIRLRGADSCQQPPGTYSPIPTVQCKGCNCGAPPEAYCSRVATDEHGYFLCDTALAWDAARASCMGAGMELAHVDDDAENTLLSTATGARPDAWLGGNDSSENIWRWSDDNGQFWSGDSGGSPTESDGSSCSQGAAGCSFSQWGTSGSNQPDNADPGGGEGDCLSLVPNDGWYDANCALAKPYLCEAL